MTARQQQHTPEPWTVYHVNKTLAIEDGKGHEHINAVVQWPGFDSGDKPWKEKVANARRIVACVNWCAGWDERRMERDISPQHIVDAHNRVLKQRDTLAAALRRIVELNEQLPADHAGRLSHGEHKQALAALATLT